MPFDGDVREPSDLRDAVRASSPRAVVHLAAATSVGESWERAADTWHVNTIGTVNLIEALLAEAPETRLVLASTGEVYGQADELPTGEHAAVAPRSPYAASKAAAELACLQAARSRGLDVVVARAFQHEGPGRDERFAIGSWTRQIAELEQRGAGELKVGDLSAERDISDVRDVCRAYRLLLDSNVAPGTYNVASGEKISLSMIVDLLVDMASCPVEVVLDPARLRPSEIPVVWGDASKLRAATAWTPEVPLRQTLADALDYAREVVSEKVTNA